MNEQQFLPNTNLQQYNEPELIKEKIIDAKSGCCVLCCLFVLLLVAAAIVVILISSLKSPAGIAIGAIIAILSLISFYCPCFNVFWKILWDNKEKWFSMGKSINQKKKCFFKGSKFKWCSNKS